MAGKRIVVALGGNALQNTQGLATAVEQQKIVGHTARQLAEFVLEGFELVVVHGNGPQVGTIVLQQEAGSTEHIPTMPLDTCGAMSQGMVGYWLQKAIDNNFELRGIEKRAVTLITQTLVDETDPAFTNPTKPIGPFYSEEAAMQYARTHNAKMVEDSGRGWRRVVPSPVPVDIMEKDIVRDLVARGYVVVTGGGGGIPIVRTSNGLQGVEAVIDKDLAAARLADVIDADILLILTTVEHVMLDFGTSSERPVCHATVSEMNQYAAEGHFAPGSMLPKVMAAVQFVESHPGRRAVITSVSQGLAAIAGRGGTQIVLDEAAIVMEQAEVGTD